MEIKKFFIGALFLVPMLGFAASNSSLPSSNPVCPEYVFPTAITTEEDIPEQIILELVSIGSQGPNGLDGYVEQDCATFVGGNTGYLAITDDNATGVQDYFNFRVRPFGLGFRTEIVHTQANFSLNSFCVSPQGLIPPNCNSAIDIVKVFKGGTSPTLIYELTFDSSDPLNLEVCAVKMDNSAVSAWFAGMTTTQRSKDAEKTDIKVQPNPFNDLLEVNLPGTDIENDVVITLYDLLGRQLMQETFPGGQNSYTITTNDIPPGSYMLHAQSGLIRTTTKVVKAQ